MDDRLWPHLAGGAAGGGGPAWDGDAEADSILAADVRASPTAVGPLLAHEVSAAQFSALVSFAYNVGIPAFRKSSVLKAVNGGRLADVPARLKLWVKGGGRVLPGLERRRAAEAEMFMSETPPQAGRGATGVPKSVGIDRHLGQAGAVLGGAAAVTGAAQALPPWVLVVMLVVVLLAVAGFGSLPLAPAGDREGGVMFPVAVAAQLALGLVQGPLTKILDGYISDVELKQKLSAEIERQTLGYFQRTAELGAGVVMAETTSEHWLSRSWRPLLMLLLMGFLLLVGFVLPLADLIAGHRVAFEPRWQSLPDGFWQFLTVGAGGYIGGRSLEKVVGTAKPPRRAGFPFMRGSDRKG